MKKVLGNLVTYLKLFRYKKSIWHLLRKGFRSGRTWSSPRKRGSIANTPI